VEEEGEKTLGPGGRVKKVENLRGGTLEVGWEFGKGGLGTSGEVLRGGKATKKGSKEKGFQLSRLTKWEKFMREHLKR